MIDRANTICEEYAAAGYSLTLRQLYYRFVANGWIPNTQESYNKLGSVVNNARLAGEIDWNHVVDRTRPLHQLSTWDDPTDIISDSAVAYREAVWRNQRNYVEVWVEKEALADVVGRAADTWDVAYFACKGYTSQSAQWRAAMRLVRKYGEGKKCYVIHLGDHDPSGIDMTRDIDDRLFTFCRRHGADVPTVVRLALNMDQVEQYNPPPNPAKMTDTRFRAYMEQFGTESWELDALPPDVLDTLIQERIQSLIEMGQWDRDKEQQEENRRVLQAVSDRWEEVVELVG
jgi:hypothetical protein